MGQFLLFGRHYFLFTWTRTFSWAQLFCFYWTLVIDLDGWSVRVLEAHLDPRLAAGRGVNHGTGHRLLEAHRGGVGLPAL